MSLEKYLGFPKEFGLQLLLNFYDSAEFKERVERLGRNMYLERSDFEKNQFLMVLVDFTINDCGPLSLERDLVCRDVFGLRAASKEEVNDSVRFWFNFTLHLYQEYMFILMVNDYYMSKSIGVYELWRDRILPDSFSFLIGDMSVNHFRKLAYQLFADLSE